MLKGILDAKITTNMIRLGSSHAADERVTQFSLEKAEKLSKKSDRMINAAYRQMKDSEKDMVALMNKLASREVPQDHLEKYLLADFPLHYEELFTSPPDWIWALALQAMEDQAEWTTVGDTQQEISILQFWLNGRDLVFLSPPPPPQNQKSKKKKGKGKEKEKIASINPFSILSGQASQENQGH